MKPSAFVYEQPGSMEEAVTLLAQHGWGAKVLAGGQSLVPMMNLRLARPAVVVDINRLHELVGVTMEPQHVSVGALTRHQAMLTGPVIAQHCPVLAEAARHIGHLAIRMRGTVGGSLAHADPAAEWPMMAVALGAELEATSVRGQRRIPAHAFFQGVFSTVLEPDEVLTRILWPRLPATGAGAAVEEFSVRTGDFALAAAAARVEVDTAGLVTAVRVALAGVGPGPVEARAVARAAVGAASAPALQESAAAVAEDIDPVTDLHASAAYRRHLARVLTGRALVRAWKRALGQANSQEDKGGWSNGIG